jgi:hypothetical protein
METRESLTVTCLCLDFLDGDFADDEEVTSFVGASE